MMSCHNEFLEYMHEYLDEEISDEREGQLREHLQTCSECRLHFHELKKAEALVQGLPSRRAPAHFTDRVMANLPKEKKNAGARRWLKNHPFITAASLFILLMAGSVISIWNQDPHFSVSKKSNIVVERNTVIVPKGKTVNGDIVVQNGDIRIEGKVKGNVTVINGHEYLASAGSVTGEIEMVNKIFDWLWFKMKNAGKAVFQVGGP
ncbi:zf-HC2 domain-containing protein [Peribacillus sp. B-H-3]|uniref:zf-HC2 domain-containing protein n=1 Tax=Peribacillus sp. B-H-3 TaxID=3400420 RepID=UPI003B024B5B